MITTIQLSESTKRELLKLKEENQTFEEVIISLLKEIEESKQKNIDLVKAEAKVLNSINLEISKSLEGVEDVGWETVKW